jgi:hypothetical protein
LPPPSAPAAAAPATGSTGYLYEIEQAPDLLARLRILDRLLMTQSPDDLADLIGKLLEHPPGAPEEAAAARVSYLHRLGFVPSCLKADTLLVAATAPDRPKGERTTAIEGLGRGNRPPAQRKLEFLANDADPDVAKRARRVLGWDQ